MPAKYFSIIPNYVLSVSSQRKYNFYHQNTLLDAFRTNYRNIIGRNPSMVIPLLANQDLTPMLNWPTIVEIIKRETETTAYKSLNGLAPTYLSNIFSRKSTRDTVYLRNSETDLQVPLFKTVNGQNSFAYRGAHLWNSLESEVKKAPSVIVFNSQL